MNPIPYNLLRLGLLVALALMPGGAPLAGAQVAQQPPPISCLQIPFLGKIIGSVRDSDDQPLAGVTVTAHPSSGGAPVTGVTNAAGMYGIPLPPSTYRIEFRPPSGPSQTIWYKSGTSPSDATVVEVADGKTVSGLDVKLPVGAQFNVVLRDPDGAAVEQGLISVFDRDGRRVADGVTNEEGRTLTVPALPPGGYRLRARLPYGSPLLEQYHNQKPTLDAADLLTITQALGSVGVPMTLQRGAQLSGSVTDAATGAPLAGIAVNVRDAAGDGWDATTDAQGRYSLAGLASGTYQVEFRPGQPAPFSPAPLRRLVTLSAPNALAGFDAALTPGGTISGRITTSDGTPIPDVSVRVRDLDGAIDTHGSSATDGTYALYGLPSGRYTLAYSHPSRQALALAEQVTVTAATTTTVATTVLSVGGAITGTVTDPDGKPVEGVYVSVVDAASGETQNVSSYTNAAGVYTTSTTLPSGSYIVKFQPPLGERGCPLAIEYSGNAATAAAAARVTVSAPTTVSGIDAKLDYGGHITGQIIDTASGLPLYGTVQVYDATGALVVTGVSQMLGHYRTPVGLPPGAYRVRFVADGYVSLFYGGTTSLEAAVRVPSGAGNITIALPRGGTLTGRITAADTGAPLEHAAVTLYGAGDRVVATQLTAFDGSYRFKGGLPSGSYRLGVAPGKRDDGTPYFTGYEAVFSGGASSLAQAQPINLLAPRTISADLTMPTTSAPLPATPTPTTPTPPTTFWVYLPSIRR